MPSDTDRRHVFHIEACRDRTYASMETIMDYATAALGNAFRSRVEPVATAMDSMFGTHMSSRSTSIASQLFGLLSAQSRAATSTEDLRATYDQAKGVLGEMCGFVLVDLTNLLGGSSANAIIEKVRAWVAR